MTARNTTTTEPPRSDAALVYPEAGDPERWVVGAPARETSPTVFTGPNARLAALEFAHRSYGSARYFSS